LPPQPARLHMLPLPQREDRQPEDLQRREEWLALLWLRPGRQRHRLCDGAVRADLPPGVSPVEHRLPPGPGRRGGPGGGPPPAGGRTPVQGVGGAPPPASRRGVPSRGGGAAVLHRRDEILCPGSSRRGGGVYPPPFRGGPAPPAGAGLV